MRLDAVVMTSVLALGLAVPATAQQSGQMDRAASGRPVPMHRYVNYFKYSDAAIKAMTENPQDRAAAAARLAEGFGGKMENIYWFPTGGEYDGMVIWLFPDDVTVEAAAMTARATGNFTKLQAVPLMTSDEFAAAMEKAKGVKSSYTPPTATKQ